MPHVLAQLHQSFSLGLVSDGYLEVQQRKWRALALAHFFDAVIFADSFGRDAWKPSTAPFWKVLDMLGATPDAAIYVGDNPIKDFIAARQIGMTTVWVRRSGCEYTHIRPPSDEHAPDHIIRSLEELPDLVLPKADA